MSLQIVTGTENTITHRAYVGSLVAFQSRYTGVTYQNVFRLILHFLLTAFGAFRRIVRHWSFAVAYHAFEILVVDMDFPMLFQIAKFTKSFIADVATVRPFARMDHHMSFEIVAGRNLKLNGNC